MSEQKLTVKQRKFIEVYEGNATEAARLAGYKGNADTLKAVGAENLTKPYILEIIKNRQRKDLDTMIATREKRQELWTKVMNAEGVEMKDRLRASELLGKSEGDFISKIEHSGNFDLESLSDDELTKRLEALKLRVRETPEEEEEEEEEESKEEETGEDNG